MSHKFGPYTVRVIRHKRRPPYSTLWAPKTVEIDVYWRRPPHPRPKK